MKNSRRSEASEDRVLPYMQIELLLHELEYNGVPDTWYIPGTDGVVKMLIF